MTRNIFHAFDILGNISLVKFPRKTKIKDKKRFANSILKNNKSIKTVLEKTGKFSGRLRKQKTKHVLGEKTKEVLYHENNCVFRFNIDKTYFSSRLSNERKEIAKLVKENAEVLVMFAGVGPYSIVIAKNSKANKVYSNEINREANKYAKLNIELNKVKNKVLLISGDIKKVAEKLSQQNKKMDVIVMPRPQLKNTFLEQAFALSKTGTKIYYYDFCKQDEINSVIKKIEKQAKEFNKKIKILKTKKAGEIAPYKIRLRVDFKVL
ncbi:Ribosomal RNA large subunit methyltransferase I [subsurface metagenome]